MCRVSCRVSEGSLAFCTGKDLEEASLLPAFSAHARLFWCKLGIMYHWAMAPELFKGDKFARTSWAGQNPKH